MIHSADVELKFYTTEVRPHILRKKKNRIVFVVDPEEK